jgi:site-specific recombinase
VGFVAVFGGRKPFQMDRDARLVENEEVFRAANERLRSAVEARMPAADVVPFLCECADETCMGRLDLTLDDYRSLRSHERRFVMLTGHLRTAGEEVVEKRDGYDITEKPE